MSNSKKPAAGTLVSATDKGAIKKILINARQEEETRAVIVDQSLNLIDLDIESKHRSYVKGSIYKAKISRIVPSLNAVFVQFGAERNGFLSIKEIAPGYFKNAKNTTEAMKNITQELSEGQELIIQIVKEERSTKGAAVSTYISLAGCYLVLMPNSHDAGGISRQISGADRDQIKDALAQLQVPAGMSLIVRTAGLGRDIEQLKWDLEALMKLWSSIDIVANKRKAPFLIYRESDVILRSVRDYLRQDISEIVVDTEDAYNLVLQYVKRLRPEYLDRVKLHSDDQALFNRYQVEEQIESAYLREVTLPSGGSIVIDRAEALVAVDINSAQATGGSDIEETALQTNLEAAVEIARQLRIRDLGGLVVIDFIDMQPTRNQKAVENRIRDELGYDRARVQFGRISRFGLFEMSRQRIRPSLSDSHHMACPRCDGHGYIRDLQSLALSIIRLINENASSGRYSELHVHLPVSVATFILNEKRDILFEFERTHDVRVVIIPSIHLETPHYQIKRVNQGSSGNQGSRSDKLMNKRLDELPKTEKKPSKVVHENAAVKDIEFKEAPGARKNGGLLHALFAPLFGNGDKRAPSNKAPEAKTQSRQGARKRSANRSGSGTRSQGASSGQRRSAQGPRSGQSRKTASQGNPDPRKDRKPSSSDGVRQSDKRRNDADSRSEKPNESRGASTQKSAASRGGRARPSSQEQAAQTARVGSKAPSSATSNDTPTQRKDLQAESMALLDKARQTGPVTKLSKEAGNKKPASAAKEASKKPVSRSLTPAKKPTQATVEMVSKPTPAEQSAKSAQQRKNRVLMSPAVKAAISGSAKSGEGCQQMETLSNKPATTQSKMAIKESKHHTKKLETTRSKAMDAKVNQVETGASKNMEKSDESKA